MTGLVVDGARRTDAPRGEVRASVVIVAYHRPAALDLLLASLRSDHPMDVVVVVVDDDREVAEVASRHCCTIVPLAANPGYAAAVNAGARATTGSVIVFMNDDLVVEEETIDRLVSAVDDTGGVVVPRLLDEAGGTEPTVGALVTPSRLLVEWALLPDERPAWLPRRLAQKWQQPTVRSTIPAAMAAMVAAPAAILRGSPLPEAYFLYWEEQDWYWQLERQGITRWMEPTAVAHHAGGRDDVRAAKDALLAGNAIRCVRATQGRRAAAAAWPVALLWWSRLLVVDAVRQLRGATPEGRDRVGARAAGLRAVLRSGVDLVRADARAAGR